MRPLTVSAPETEERACCCWRFWGTLAAEAALRSPEGAGGTHSAPCALTVTQPGCCKAFHHTEAPGHTGLGGGGHPVPGELAPWGLQVHACPENAGVDSNTLDPGQCLLQVPRLLQLAHRTGARPRPREGGRPAPGRACSDRASTAAWCPGCTGRCRVSSERTEQGHGAGAVPGARRHPG